MLLRLTHDDLMHWRFGDDSIYQFDLAADHPPRRSSIQCATQPKRACGSCSARRRRYGDVTVSGRTAARRELLPTSPGRGMTWSNDLAMIWPGIWPRRSSSYLRRSLYLCAALHVAPRPVRRSSRRWCRPVRRSGAAPCQQSEPRHRTPLAWWQPQRRRPQLCRKERRSTEIACDLLISLMVKTPGSSGSAMRVQIHLPVLI